MFQRVPDRLQEFQQRAFALGKFESKQSLVGDVAVDVAADHVTHVQLGDLVVGHVGDAVSRGAQLRDHLVALFLAARDAEADEDLRALLAAVSGS